MIKSHIGKINSEIIDIILKKESYFRIRKYTITHFSFPITEDTIDGLLNSFQYEPDYHVRSAYIQKIINVISQDYRSGGELIPSDDFMATMNRCYAHEPHIKVRYEIVAFAEMIPDDRTIPILIGGLIEPNCAIRDLAVEGITSLDDPDYLPIIIRSLEREISIKEKLTCEDIIPIYGYDQLLGDYVSFTVIQDCLTFIAKYGDERCIENLKKLKDDKFKNVLLFSRLMYRSIIDDIRKNSKEILNIIEKKHVEKMSD